MTDDRIDESQLEVHEPKDAAAGVTGVRVAMERSLSLMGPRRSAQTLLKLNHADGFDCMSCAWPDPAPKDRHTAEFCENGAKAVAWEGDTTRATPDFFARHSIADLEAHDDMWLERQGRLTHPLVKRSGGTHYEPIGWDEAFAEIARTLRGLASPDQASFYTSGRASNEAAFLYQLFVRAYGTNNLPDCSNMCHESTSIALQESIGIGKASVTISDVYNAELIIIAGQNPGTNHPRMLSALEVAKRRGAKIIAINPLREAGLVNFRNPQKPRGVVGRGTDIADLHLPIKPNGDLALLQAIGSLLVEWDALDHDFIDRHTTGFEEWAEHVRHVDWEQVERVTDLTRAQITEAAEMLRASRATVWCWAMGITQHRNAVATIKELCNLAFARGDLGKKGAGLFPVRGHSNVQGDRTMGIWERPPQKFLDSLQAEFGFDPPRHEGLDTVDTIRGLRDGKVEFFMGLGGNFVTASPDTDVTRDAMRRATMTVHVATKLNRSHLTCGDVALLLPTLGRTEKHVEATGEQIISVEDSVCSVHASHGPLEPASPHLRSEISIIAGIAAATLADAEGGADRHGIDWLAMRDDYDVIRDHISRVVAGCDDYNARVRKQGGFVLPHPPRDSRSFETKSGRGEFEVSPIEVLNVPDGHLLLHTMRSHDQFNTTIYGTSDRYRGIEGGRHVVFMHREDIAAHGLEPGDFVDLHTRWEDDDVERCADRFRVVAYDVPRGTVGAYYPEANVLVPLDSTALKSNQPTYKSVVVWLTRSTPHTHGGADGGDQDEVRADDAHKTHPQPTHLS